MLRKVKQSLYAFKVHIFKVQSIKNFFVFIRRFLNMEGFLNSCTKQKKEGSIISLRTSLLITWAIGPITVGYKTIDNVHITRNWTYTQEKHRSNRNFSDLLCRGWNNTREVAIGIGNVPVFKVNLSNFDDPYTRCSWPSRSISFWS